MTKVATSKERVKYAKNYNIITLTIEPVQKRLIIGRHYVIHLPQRDKIFPWGLRKGQAKTSLLSYKD